MLPMVRMVSIFCLLFGFEGFRLFIFIPINVPPLLGNNYMTVLIINKNFRADFRPEISIHKDHLMNKMYTLVAKNNLKRMV